jgi:hypothetical protein
MCMQDSSYKLVGLIGGGAYVFVGIGSFVLGWLQTYATLSQPNKFGPANSSDTEYYLFGAIVLCFLIGMIAYRMIAMRKGFHPSWIWYTILASGLAMIFAGIVTGRVVLILFGVSNLLHVFGTREVYFRK